jgi:hypothetical protein
MRKFFARFGAPIALTMVTVLALWLPHFFFHVSQSTLILTLTLVAILWYTWETRRMQGALAKQTGELVYQRRLSILPKLSVGFGRQNLFPQGIGDFLQLTNIGNGTAVNISVDDIELQYEEGAVAWITFQRYVFLEPTKSTSALPKTAHLRMWIRNPNVASENMVQAIVPELYSEEPAMFLKKCMDDQNVTIAVRFQDIDGTSYLQSAILGLDQQQPYSLELGATRLL